MRWVGPDVHAQASTLAVFDDVTGEVITRRGNGRPIEALTSASGRLTGLKPVATRPVTQRADEFPPVAKADRMIHCNTAATTPVLT
jgi:hypothetical protein